MTTHAFPALHFCPHCHRRPSTHPHGGEDACGACGLGDDTEDPEETGEEREAREEAERMAAQAATVAARAGACLPAGTVVVRL